MSHKSNDTYLENKKDEFEDIITEGRWEEVDAFYKEIEDEGMGQYVKEISELMTDDDVKEYKKWDRETNGSIETQTDDSGQDDRGGDYLELI